MEATASLVPTVGVRAACLALGVPRATFYRWHRAPVGAAAPTGAPPRVHPRALAADERQAVLAALHSARSCAGRACTRPT